MPALLITAPRSLDGKTTVAAALGRRFSELDRTVDLARLSGDANAAADAAFFAGVPFNAGEAKSPLEPTAVTAGANVTIVEAPAGDARELAASLSARVVVVAAYADPLPADVPSFCQALGDSCAGVALTRVPVRRLDAVLASLEALGVPVVALLSEDRTLAAPSLRGVAEALGAESRFLNSASENIIDRPIISSISADPAQGYFAHTNPNAVIVRGDKPDQQLGALNAGAPCLIVTGGLPVLSYVEQRAEEERIPIVKTDFDTATVVRRLEALYGATPFAGRAKLERVAELVGDLDASSLV